MYMAFVFVVFAALHRDDPDRQLSLRGYLDVTCRFDEIATTPNAKLRGLEAVWYYLGLHCIPPAFHFSVLVHSASVIVPGGHFLEGGMALVHLQPWTGQKYTHAQSGRGAGGWQKSTRQQTPLWCQHAIVSFLLWETPGYTFVGSRRGNTLQDTRTTPVGSSKVLSIRASRCQHDAKHASNGRHFLRRTKPLFCLNKSIAPPTPYSRGPSKHFCSPRVDSVFELLGESRLTSWYSRCAYSRTIQRGKAQSDAKPAGVAAQYSTRTGRTARSPSSERCLDTMGRLLKKLMTKFYGRFLVFSRGLVASLVTAKLKLKGVRRLIDCTNAAPPRNATG